MNSLIFIAVVSSITVVKCHDNVAMESYRSSYKVHPDPQDLEEENPHSHLHGSYSSTGPEYSGSWNAGQGLQDTLQNGPKIQTSTWSRPESHTTNGFDSSSYRGHTSVYHSSVKFPEQQESQIQHHQSQYSNQPYRVEGGGLPVKDYEENKTEFQQASGFTSTVEHVTENDDASHSNVQSGPAGDIKRIIPKSTVYFKMFHAGKERNPTEIQSNVLHEHPPSLSVKEHAQKDQHLVLEQYESPEKPKTYTHLASYVTSGAHEKVPVHAKPSYFSKENYKLAPQEITKDSNYLSYQNYVKTHTGFKEGQKSRFNIPHQTLPQLQHQQQQLYHLYHGQAQKPSEETSQHFSQTTTLDQNSAGATVGQHTQTGGGTRRPKIVKYVKHASLVKDKYRGPQGTKTSNFLTLYPAPDEIPAQPDIAITNEKPAPSTISNAFTTALSSWKTFQYPKNPTKIKNTWKHLKHIPAIKSIDFQHSFSHLPLVYKPADTFHFEVNPFIDIDENNQESFDHQKALEGSTTFDINHAIGAGNQDVTVGPELIPAAQHLKTHNSFAPQNTPAYLIKQHALYSSPAHKIHPTPLSPLKTTTLHAEDSLSSSSDLLQPTPAPMIQLDSKYLLQPHLSSTLAASSFKQKPSQTPNPFYTNPIRLHLPSDQDLQNSLKFNKFLKTSFPTYPKIKKYLKDPAWEKLLQDASFQHPKNRQHLFLHSRPSQNLFPLLGNDFTLHTSKPRTAKSNTFLIKPNAMPHFSHFENKLFPVLIKTSQKRIHRDVSGKPATSQGSSSNQSHKNQTQSQSHQSHSPPADSAQVSNLNNTQNQFSVSASYKIDRTLKQDQPN